MNFEPRLKVESLKQWLLSKEVDQLKVFVIYFAVIILCLQAKLNNFIKEIHNMMAKRQGKET